jgi:hypothetical protein
MAGDQLDLGGVPVTGPFSNILAEPAYQGSKQPTVSGYGGAGESVAMFADKFLAGVSQGRRSAFERGEKERADNMTAIKMAMQDVSSAPIPDSMKQQKLGQLQGMIGQMILHDHSLDGQQQGGGKKKKQTYAALPGGPMSFSDMGAGKIDPAEGGEHPAHTILNTIRQFASNMVGPGAQQQPFSSDQLKHVLGDVYSTVRDPNNSIDAHAKQFDDKLSAIAQDITKQNGGAAPTYSQMMNNPQFRETATEAMRLMGGKPTPGLANILGLGQQQEELQDPTRLADLKWKHSQTGYNEAQTVKDKALTDEAMVRTRIAGAMRTRDGGQVFLNADGSYSDSAGKVIPGGDPRLNGMTPWNKSASGLKREVGNDGIVHYVDPATGQTVSTATDANGRPIRSTSPLGRALLIQREQDERFDEGHLIAINEKYDTQQNIIERNPNLSAKQKREQLEQNEENRAGALGLVGSRKRKGEAPPQQKAKANAPAGKPSAPDAATAAVVDWLTGTAPAASGGAPAGASNDPGGLLGK